MKTLVNVLAVLMIAVGSVYLPFSLLWIWIFASGQGDGLFHIGPFGATYSCYIAMVSLMDIMVGIDLFHLRPGARTAAILLSWLSLASLPFGTMVGWFGLWVLRLPQTSRL